MPPVEMPTAFNTKGDILTGFNAVQTRIDELEAKFKNPEQKDPEGYAGLRKQVEDLVTGFTKWQEENASRQTASSLFSPDGEARLRGLTLPYEPDPEFRGVSKAQWNIIGFHPNELATAASAYGRAALGGMSPRVFHAVQRDKGYDSFERTCREVQYLNDALLIIDAILAGDGETEYAHRGNRAQRMSTLKLYPQYKRAVDEFQRVLTTGGTGTGKEWLPAFFSAQVHDLVEFNANVWSLFPVMDMPGMTFQSPVLSSDAICYLVPQASGDGSGTAIPATTPGTTNMTLTAVKLAARMHVNSETLEDHIVAVLPFMFAQFARAFSRGLDDAVLNGDVAATHVDASAGTDAPTAATDRRKAWLGIRSACLGGTGTAGVISGMPLVDISAATDTALWSLKTGMGIYGVNPSDLAFITSPMGVLKAMRVKDANNNNVFFRADIMGQSPVLMTGQMGTLFGSPLIVSDRMPDDTSGTTGKRAAAATYSELLCVYRPGWQRGNRRALTIKRTDERYAEYDQSALIGTFRGAFEPWFALGATAPLVACGYKF